MADGDAADKILGIASGKTNVAATAQAGVQSGLQVAEFVNKIGEQRQQLEMVKEKLKFKKLDSVLSTITTGFDKVPKKARASYFRNFVQKRAEQVGLPIDQSFFDAITSEDVNQSGVAKAMLDVQAGIKQFVQTGQKPEDLEESAAKVLSSFDGDTTQFGQFLTRVQSSENTIQAQKQAQLAQRQKAEFIEGEKTARAETTRQEVGNVERRRGAAKIFTEEYTKGGAATIRTNLARLKDAHSALSRGKIKTGEGLTKWIGGSDFALDIINPEVAATRDKIRSAIVSTLRPILGAQFAEAEGKRILALSFNTRLKSDENAARVRAEIQGIFDRVKSQEDEFVKQGFVKPEETASGKNPELFKLPEPKDKQGKQGKAPTQESKGLPGIPGATLSKWEVLSVKAKAVIMKKLSLTEEAIRKQLGGQ